MVNKQLSEYVKSSRGQGLTEDEIKNRLLQGGWQAPDIEVAMNERENMNVSPPPPPVPQFGMWVTFQYIIHFISLYVAATCLGGLLNDAVDHFIPDSLNATAAGYQAVGGTPDPLLRGYIAGLIVSYPIFAILFLVLQKHFIEKPMVRNLKARKLLIYFTLVVTFIMILVQTTVIIYSLLGGQVTGRTLGHLGVTLLIVGSIFLYFLFEVRTDRKSV